MKRKKSESSFAGYLLKWGFYCFLAVVVLALLVELLTVLWGFIQRHWVWILGAAIIAGVVYALIIHKKRKAAPENTAVPGHSDLFFGSKLNRQNTQEESKFLRELNAIMGETISQEDDSTQDSEPLEETAVLPGDSPLELPNWHISISFGKSSSQNYLKAVTLAKAAPYYHEQDDDGHILHQAIYSAAPKEFIAYLMLYEIVGSWKSAFVMINGELIDRKIVGQLNYCYGDKCRSGKRLFCYGASYMTENPFGCHRLQISAVNHPWWSFYTFYGNKYVLDKASMLQRINEAASIYHYCPRFDYDAIVDNLEKLPDTLSDRQMQELRDNNFGLKITI